MAGIEERRVHAWRDRDLDLIRDGLEQGNRRIRVIGRVQRGIQVRDGRSRRGAQSGLGIELHRRREGGLLIGILGRGTIRMLAGEPVVPRSELLLQFGRVKEHQARELDRPGRRVDRATEAGGNDVRNEPAVVEVGVGQQHRIDRWRVVGERHVIADGVVRSALEHPAVDEHLCLGRFEQELGAGHGVGPAEEVDSHGPMMRR